MEAKEEIPDKDFFTLCRLTKLTVKIRSEVSSDLCFIEQTYLHLVYQMVNYENTQLFLQEKKEFTVFGRRDRQATWKEYTVVARIYRGKIRK